ncbi:MAG: hypothetical protein SOY67_05485 [Collinsella sp.]|nr:hypothetical protein [Collinsella sp.]
MSITFSHSTARSYHRSPWKGDASRLSSIPQTQVPPGALYISDLIEARNVLAARGVPGGDLETVDVVVRSAGRRRDLAGTRAHVLGCELEPDSLLQIAPGALVTDVRLTALLSAQDLTFLELVEYYCEICGAYDLPLEPEDGYRERAPLTTVAELASYFERMANRVRGSKRARRALAYVREGLRSPLETAMVMMLVLPRSMGGFGMRSLLADHHLEIPPHARHLTRRSYLVCDAYLPSHKIDFEYHGFGHDAEEQASIDDERVNTLRAMGIRVIAIRRWAFFDSAAFRRFSGAVIREAKIARTRLPYQFERLQEDLRQFVLRRYTVRA